MPAASYGVKIVNRNYSIEEKAFLQQFQSVQITSPVHSLTIRTSSGAWRPIFGAKMDNYIYMYITGNV